MRNGPSWTSDFEIEEEIAGHVVLVGVVASRQQADLFVACARSVSGVVSMNSFIETM